MDVIGPWEVFASWKSLYPDLVTLNLVSEVSGNISCANNIVLVSHYSYLTAPAADILIVPGGRGRLKAVDNVPLIGFIQSQARSTKYVASVCTGVFLLVKAGLCEHKKITTYWRALPELAKLKDVNIIEERVVRDNNIWSAGGVTSGIDLALHLIADLAGESVAGEVQLALEYFPDDIIFAKRSQLNTLPAYSTLADQEHAVKLPDYIKII